MAELYRYAAFISYSSKDAKFAQRLHRALESYGIPSSLGKFDLIGGGGKQNRIYPVFRDREELSAGHLGDQIEANLRASAALIVVCSPNGAASPWVQKEIEFFAALGRHAKIFAIIPDTAPLIDDTGADCTQSCFPPAFRGDALSGDKLEPLAADARKGKDGFRNAWLKIVAGMIGVTPAQIIDRDKKRRAQQRRAFAMGATLLLLGGAALSGWFSQRTWRAELADHANRGAAGDPIRAMAYAVAAAPSETDLLRAKPPIADTAMELTGVGTMINSHLGNVRDGKLSHDGSMLLIRRDDGLASLMNLVDHTQIELAERVDEQDYYFSPNDRFLITQSEGDGYLHNLSAQERTELGPLVLLGSSFSADSSLMVVQRPRSASHILDLRTMEQTSIGELTAWDLSSDNEYLVVSRPNGRTELWNVVSGTRIRLDRDWPSVAFVPRTHVLFLQSEDDALLQDINDGATFSLPKSAMNLANFSSDGGTVTYPTGDSVIVRQVASGTERVIPDSQYAHVSPSGRFIVALTAERMVELHDMVGGTVRPLGASQNPIMFFTHLTQVIFSDDDRLAAFVGDQNDAVLCELVGGECRALGKLNAFGMDFSDDANFLVATRPPGRGGVVFDLRGDAPQGTPLGEIRSATFSAQGALFTVSADRVGVLRDTAPSRTISSRLREGLCARNRDSLVPFAAETRASIGLDGRPWNPCDWRGLLAILPRVDRGDGWFEGLGQWVRLVQIRFGGHDYDCEETTSAASAETRARRADICERFANQPAPAPT